MRLRAKDFFCLNPDETHHWDTTVDLEDPEWASKVRCPECGAEMQEVWIKAPLGRIGAADSTRSIESMKQSFRERFVKKEIDDVRHRWGRLYDDSIQSAAAQRIKKGEKPI